MIIVIGGTKGGTGKTTTNTNLTTMRAKKGKDVMLVDTNKEQNSSSMWCDIRNGKNHSPTILWLEKFGKNLNKELKSLSTKYDDVFVDCGGYDDVAFRSSLTVADVFISPVLPSQLDLWTLGKIDGIIEEVKIINPLLKAYFIVNKAPTNPQITETEEAIAHIKDCNFENVELLEEVVIYDRRVFRKVIPKGLAVVEYLPSDDKAILELERLYNYIFKD